MYTGARQVTDKALLTIACALLEVSQVLFGTVYNLVYTGARQVTDKALLTIACALLEVSQVLFGTVYNLVYTGALQVGSKFHLHDAGEFNKGFLTELHALKGTKQYIDPIR